MTPKECPGLNAACKFPSLAGPACLPGVSAGGRGSLSGSNPPPQSVGLMVALAAPTTSRSDEGLHCAVWVQVLTGDQPEVQGEFTHKGVKTAHGGQRGSLDVPCSEPDP